MSPPPSIATLLVRSIVDDKFISELNSGTVPSEPPALQVPADKLKEFALELAVAVIEGEISVEKFISGFEVVGQHENAAEVLADVFWLLWVGYEPTKGSQQEDQQQAAVSKLTELVKECIKHQKVSRRALMETSESEFLQEVGIIPTADMWRKKEVRFNTKHTYQQQRYNMLREESEGYAKALTCLLQLADATLDKAGVADLKAQLIDLIGCFDLDPNRLLSLVLEANEVSPTSSNFTGLIGSIFNASAVSVLLGFKFLCHQKPNSPPAPESLYVLAARLIASGHVKLEELLAYLTPVDDKATGQIVQKALSDLKERAEGIGQRNLNDKQDDGAQGPRRVSANTVELDARSWATDVLPASVTSDNQRLGLVLGLLKVDDWRSAKQLMDQLQVKSDMAAAAYPPVAKQLCATISARLQPIYSHMYPNGVLGGPCVLDAEKPEPGPRVTMQAFEMLRYLGVYLFQDPVLMTKLARILRHQMVFHSKLRDESDKSTALVTETVARVLMPAVSMCAGNPGLVQELWQLLQLFPAILRHRIYYDVKLASKDHPLLLAASRLAKEEVRKVLRRVAVSKDKQDRNENSKPLSRIMAKAALCQPSAMADAMFTYITYGEQMLEATVESLRYLHPLCFDVLSFEILAWLASDTEEKKVKEDGVSVTVKQQSLAACIGWLCRKSPDMDITSLCQYLLHRLRENKSMDIIILKELITRMTGITIVNQVSEGQFDILACSELLQEQLITMSGMFGSKSLAKGCTRLLKALQTGAPNQHLLLPIMVLLAQQPALLPWRYMRARPMPLKMASEMIDRCSETFLAYVEMMQKAMSYEEYRAILPPLQMLHKTYGVPVEMCMLLYRPVLRSLEGQNPLNAEDGEIQDAMEEGEENTAPEVVENGDPAPKPTESKPEPSAEWTALMKDIRDLLPANCWRVFTTDFYTTFWGLTYYDLHCPVKVYEDEIKRLKQEVFLLEDQMRPKLRSHHNHRDMEPPKTEEELAELARQKSRNLEMVEKLGQDLEQHQKRVEDVNARLNRDKGHWFQDSKNGGRMCQRAVIHECLFPRMLLTPTDALFCFHFLMKLHTLDTPNHLTALFFDKVLRMDIVHVVPFCCTDYEVNNLGVFLLEMLKQAEHWRSSEQVYKMECKEKHCFLDKSGPLAYDMYRQLAFKWQFKLAMVLRHALDSSEYHLVHNALLLLNKLAQTFPSIIGHANQLRDSAIRVQNRDARGDLKLMAQSYVAALSAELKKPGRMLTKEEYMGAANVALMEKKTRQARAAPSAQASDASKGVVKAEDRKLAALRPEAPSFLPKAPAAAAASVVSEPKQGATKQEARKADSGTDNGLLDRTSKRQRTDGSAPIADVAEATSAEGRVKAENTAAAPALKSEPPSTENPPAPAPRPQTKEVPSSEPTTANSTPSRGVKREAPSDGPGSRGLKREADAGQPGSDTKRRRATDEDGEKPIDKGSKEGKEESIWRDNSKEELEAGETREPEMPAPRPKPSKHAGSRDKDKEGPGIKEHRDKELASGKDAGARKRSRSSERGEVDGGHKDKERERGRDARDTEVEKEKDARGTVSPQARDAERGEEVEPVKGKREKGHKHELRDREGRGKEDGSSTRSRSKQRVAEPERGDPDRGKHADKDGEARGHGSKGRDGKKETEQDRSKQGDVDGAQPADWSKQERGRERGGRGDDPKSRDGRYGEEGEHVSRHTARDSTKDRLLERDLATNSPYRDVDDDGEREDSHGGKSHPKGSHRGGADGAGRREKNLVKAAISAVQRQDESKGRNRSESRGGDVGHSRHGGFRSDGLETAADLDADVPRESGRGGSRAAKGRGGKHENISFDLPDKKRK